jgi:hypothetical protein
LAFALPMGELKCLWRPLAHEERARESGASVPPHQTKPGNAPATPVQKE